MDLGIVMRPNSIETAMRKTKTFEVWAIPLLLSPLSLIITPMIASAQTPPQPSATPSGTTTQLELPQPNAVPPGNEPKVNDAQGNDAQGNDAQGNEAKGDDNSNVQQVVIPLSGEVRKRIQEALRQPTKDQRGNPLPPASTGDPILDDVLQVIRNRGSILEGSSLDPQADLKAPPQPSSANRIFRPDPQQPLPRSRVEGFPNPQTYPPEPPSGYRGEPRYGSSDAEQARPDSRFIAAEALLRAARLLADTPASDEGTATLINSMRERAAMLLIDQFTPDPNRLENAP